MHPETGAPVTSNAAEPGRSREYRPLVVALDRCWPPFSLLNARGEPEGLLIDLWRTLGDRMARTIVFRLTDWNDSIELVLAGEADVHGGLLRSAERERVLAFSVGLLELSAFLFVHSSFRVSHLSELGDVPVGITKGSFEYEFVCSNAPYLEPVLYANNSDMVTAAVGGEIAAFVADYPVGMHLLAARSTGEKKRFRPVDVLYTRFLRVGMREDASDLLSSVNNAIEALPRRIIEDVAERHVPERGFELIPQWLLPAALAGDGLVAVAFLVSEFGVLIRERERLRRDLEQCRFHRLELDRQFTDLAANLPGFVYRCLNDRRWTVKYISKGCVMITGYPPEAFMHGERLSLADIIVPEAHERLHRAVGKSIESGGIFDEEYRMIDRDGNEHWVLERGRPVFADDGSVRFLEGFVTDVTERKRAEDAVRENGRLQRLVAEISTDFVTATADSMHSKVQSMFLSVASTLGLDRGYVLRLGADGVACAPVHAWSGDNADPFDESTSIIPLGEFSYAREVLTSGEVLHAARVDELPKQAKAERSLLVERGVVSFIWIPTFTEETLTGVVGFETVARVHRWSESQIGSLRIIANILSDALRRSALELELQQRSVTDPLTGAYNRRFLFERMSVATDEYAREGRLFSVAMFDLDHFKKLNDEYGHNAGDSILRHFVSVMNDAVRPSDVVARYGGEEFVLLLPGADTEAASAIAERILRSVRESVVEVETQTFRYTVSCGVAGCEERAQTSGELPESLIERADRRLYAAKEGGRDRVVAK